MLFKKYPLPLAVGLKAIGYRFKVTGRPSGNGALFHLEACGHVDMPERLIDAKTLKARGCIHEVQ